MPAKAKYKRDRFERWGYLFVAPFIIVFITFQFIPLANTFFLGFTNQKGSSLDYSLVGFANFARELKNIKIEGLSAADARKYTDALTEKGFNFDTNAPAAPASGDAGDPFAITLDTDSATTDPAKETNSLGNSLDMFDVAGVTDGGEAVAADGYYISYSKMEGADYAKAREAILAIGVSAELLDKSVKGTMTGVIFDPVFYTTIWNNLIIWFFNIVPQIGLALLFAVWLTDLQLRLRMTGVFKTVFYMPNILMASAVSVLFASLFGFPTGPLNQFLVQLLGAKEAVNFFRDGVLTRGIVSFIQFWLWFGPTMIIMLAGILGISESLYESAIVDGATKGQVFRFITLPLLRPVMSYIMVTSVIGGLQMFDIPYLITNRRGDPAGAIQTPSIYIFNQAFSSANNYSYASALSVGMFLLILVLAMVVFFLSRDQDDVDPNKLAKKNRKAAK